MNVSMKFMLTVLYRIDSIVMIIIFIRSYSIFGYASDEGSKQSYNMARICKKCLGFYAYSFF